MALEAHHKYRTEGLIQKIFQPQICWCVLRSALLCKAIRNEQSTIVYVCTASAQLNDTLSQNSWLLKPGQGA